MFLENFKICKSLEAKNETYNLHRYSFLRSKWCLLYDTASIKQKFLPATIAPLYCVCQSWEMGPHLLYSPDEFLHLSSLVLLSVERRGHLVILHLFKSTPINSLSFPNKCGAKHEDV